MQIKELKRTLALLLGKIPPVLDSEIDNLSETFHYLAGL
jgi:hypothetical protein